MEDQDPPPPDSSTGNGDRDPNVDEEPTSVASQENKLYENIDRFISVSADDQSDSSPLPEIIESVQSFADLFDVMIVEHESGSKKWIQLDENESSCFIESVDRTAKLLRFLSRFHSEQNYADAINRLSGIQQRAMCILEDEFKSIMDDYQTSFDRDRDRDRESKTDEAKMKQQSSSSSNVVPEATEPELPEQSESSPEKDEFLGYSEEMLSNLNKLAMGLIGGGHEMECGELYFFVRRNAIEQNLKIFGLEKLSIDEMQKMQWEPIEKEIRDSIPAVEKLISDEWLCTLKSAASLINTTIGESIFTIFLELENSIKSDATKTPVPGGAIHPLNRYVMNYLKSACEYSHTLEQVFRELKTIDRHRPDSATGSDDDDQDSQAQAENVNNNNHESASNGSPFHSQLAKIMDLLNANLEAKSRLYKDPSLSLIFLMNNGRYILQKTKGTGEMRSLLGDPWVRKQSSDLRSYHTSYKRETWTKLLQCLRHEGLSANGKVMKPVLKERFKSFNAMFDEIHRTQATWVVSDEQLRSELRVSISAIVIPAYRSFMGRFSQVFTAGRQTEKYIKYQPEDIETCIEELFDGSAAQQSKKR
ncbi:hypothetical protein E3N88_01855 [Mikania micrantha]|uniref:Exocyst subunit Exo70 family protein n=1 Tax=Mikania micrantha TaxID=192012 RepID=A0A5N6Q2A5_9ASTR|nr:hypothetical protein E3N88_01855 [Mikania micrantha]